MLQEELGSLFAEVGHSSSPFLPFSPLEDSCVSALNTLHLCTWLIEGCSVLSSKREVWSCSINLSSTGANLNVSGGNEHFVWLKP